MKPHTTANAEKAKKAGELLPHALQPSPREQLPQRPKSTLPTSCSANAARFATIYTPRFAATTLAQNVPLGQLALSPKAPSLALLREHHGTEAVALWLGEHLRSLSDYAGQTQGLDDAQIEELAHLLLADNFDLNAAEIALFFAKFKLGKYGRFYACVDPLTIAEALTKFRTERRKSIAKVERQRQAAAREQELQGTINRQQYEALLAQARAGNPEALAQLQPPNPQTRTLNSKPK